MALASSRPLIVSLHGGAFRDFYATRGPIGRAWIRMVMRRATPFIVLTESWKRWVDSVEPKSYVVIIPNPVPELPVLEPQASVRSAPKPSGAPASPLLLFLGRIENEKGIFVLLEALALAKQRGAIWRLICAGTGDLDLAMKQARALGLNEHDVQFVGWVEGNSKRGLLQDCNMLVLPSLAENMPVVLLEAFAYAKPVLATRVGGIPDMVRHGIDGFLCQAGDSKSLAEILEVALLPETDLKRMGAAGRARAEAQYTATRVVAQIESIYAKLLGGG